MRLPPPARFSRSPHTLILNRPRRSRRWDRAATSRVPTFEHLEPRQLVNSMLSLVDLGAVTDPLGLDPTPDVLELFSRGELTSPFGVESSAGAWGATSTSPSLVSPPSDGGEGDGTETMESDGTETMESTGAWHFMVNENPPNFYHVGEWEDAPHSVHFPRTNMGGGVYIPEPGPVMIDLVAASDGSATATLEANVRSSFAGFGGGYDVVWTDHASGPVGSVGSVANYFHSRGQDGHSTSKANLEAVKATATASGERGNENIATATGFGGLRAQAGYTGTPVRAVLIDPPWDDIPNPFSEPLNLATGPLWLLLADEGTADGKGESVPGVSSKSTAHSEGAGAFANAFALPGTSPRMDTWAYSEGWIGSARAEMTPVTEEAVLEYLTGTSGYGSAGAGTTWALGDPMAKWASVQGEFDYDEGGFFHADGKADRDETDVHLTANPAQGTGFVQGGSYTSEGTTFPAARVYLGAGAGGYGFVIGDGFAKTYMDDRVLNQVTQKPEGVDKVEFEVGGSEKNIDAFSGVANGDNTRILVDPGAAKAQADFIIHYGEAEAKVRGEAARVETVDEEGVVGTLSELKFENVTLKGMEGGEGSVTLFGSVGRAGGGMMTGDGFMDVNSDASGASEGKTELDVLMKYTATSSRPPSRVIHLTSSSQSLAAQGGDSDASSEVHRTLRLRARAIDTDRGNRRHLHQRRVHGQGRDVRRCGCPVGRRSGASDIGAGHER